MIVIKFDQKTLPEDGRKVRWTDLNDETKEGIYTDEDQLFLVGFEESASAYTQHTK